MKEEILEEVKEEGCCCNHEHQDDMPHCCGGGCCHEQEPNNKEVELTNEIARLTEENNNLVEKVKLAQAELINYRKRKDEETANLLKYANQDLILEIISVVDNFERAIKLDDDDLTDELSKFLEGFKMVYCNQVNILEKYGVKAIDGNNKVFDPNYHQAVLTEHREGVEPGMVLEILQKGYLLKDKVIRHAMVKVSE